MNSDPKTVDEIRAQMRVIRRDLRANVQGIVDNASQMFDWKNYVRSFPWVAVGGAAIIGFMLVPRRRVVTAHIPQKTQESLEKLTHEIHAAVAPARPPVASSLMATLLPVVGGIAFRVGTSYLTRMGSNWLDQMTQATPSSANRAPGRAAETPSAGMHTVQFPKRR